MNAPIRVVLGVTERQRASGRWKETITRTEPFYLETTQELYPTSIDAFITQVWSWAASRRAEGLELQIQYTVRLENLTASTPSKGSWVQAKQNYNGTLADGDLTGSESIKEKLDEIVSVVTANANY